MLHASSFLVSAAALAAFAHFAAADAPPISECKARTEVDHNYLTKVCEYVLREKVPVTSHPNTWKILRLEDGALDGHPVTIVHLSCCYLGDIAYFDKVSGKLVKYDPGDK
jgi:hypothetical protein